MFLFFPGKEPHKILHLLVVGLRRLFPIESNALFLDIPGFAKGVAVGGRIDMRVDFFLLHFSKAILDVGENPAGCKSGFSLLAAQGFNEMEMLDLLVGQHRKNLFQARQYADPCQMTIVVLAILFHLHGKFVYIQRASLEMLCQTFNFR